MVLLAAIALIAVGPKQLPEVARVVGRFMNDLKRTTGEFTKTFMEARDSTENLFVEARRNLSIDEILDSSKPESPHHDSSHNSAHSLSQDPSFNPDQLPLTPQSSSADTDPGTEEDQLAFNIDSSERKES